ncbi:hypothetical protein BM221_010598 [Beauveria bassiana]|uniref:Uncharacterized protein n=1 Tax=Beauveria bassiana TaxID=176275 RepID=A0A2N6N889_BEABA|nr:hypothetical protein BM221_010598 [Beauveria bassiana]
MTIPRGEEKAKLWGAGNWSCMGVEPSVFGELPPVGGRSGQFSAAQQPRGGDEWSLFAPRDSAKDAVLVPANDGLGGGV